MVCKGENNYYLTFSRKKNVATGWEQKHRLNILSYKKFLYLQACDCLTYYKQDDIFIIKEIYTGAHMHIHTHTRHNVTLEEESDNQAHSLKKESYG